MNIRMPTEKAHGYQIAKMCESLASLGAQLSLIIPTRKNDALGNIFSYYEIQHNFSVEYVPSFDGLAFFRGSRLGFYTQTISFLLALYNSVDISHDTVVVTRNPEIAWWYGRKGYRVFYDAHNFPVHGIWFFKWLLHHVRGIIANSNGTAEAFRQSMFTNVLVAPNAVDLKQFTSTDVRQRSELGLPSGSIAMYVGHLYEWKGIRVVINAARRSKIKNLTFVLVGGTDYDLKRYRLETKDLQNVIFLGRRSHREVPALIKSADALLLPNAPSTQESILYTSPIKMFEYMASGVPIVASDIPSIKEILNNKNAILVKAGDPRDLLLGIERALSDRSQERVMHAKEDVKEYTWGNRADRIISFINSK